jgi:hypothetical protein
MVVLAVMPGSLVVARRAPVAWMEQSHHVTADPAAWAELVARAAILELAELEAVAVPGRAVAVVWAWRAVAALVAVAAREETVMTPRRSMTVRLVATAERAALVELAAMLARLARTPQR